MSVKVGVVQFPGSCDEFDTVQAVERVEGASAELLWHKEHDLKAVDAVVIPGGFSYGDYLRVGAIARFSPLMESIADFAAAGGLVLGICNGFQVLCEAGLLPGALLTNTSLRFICRQVRVEVVNINSPFTNACSEGEQLSIPIKHTSGRYFAPQDLLTEIEERGQVLLRYLESENPNGSLNNIAGVSNTQGNVFGLMPHPEHATDRLLGSGDGLKIFHSMFSVVTV